MILQIWSIILRYIRNDVHEIDFMTRNQIDTEQKINIVTSILVNHCKRATQLIVSINKKINLRYNTNDVRNDEYWFKPGMLTMHPRHG